MDTLSFLLLKRNIFLYKNISIHLEKIQRKIVFNIILVAGEMAQG